MPTTVKQHPLVAMLAPISAVAANSGARITSRTPPGSGASWATSARVWTSPVNMGRWGRGANNRGNRESCILTGACHRFEWRGTNRGSYVAVLRYLVGCDFTLFEVEWGHQKISYFTG
jgi:hypothetical protein